VNIVFSSRVPTECRAELEELLFLNPRQHLVRDGILSSLERFGHPKVIDTPTGLAVKVGDLEAQTLFAFDRTRDGEAPVGVVVFIRTASEEMSIMHVAVHEDYALHGAEAGVGLGVTLVEKVKEIARRIVGIQRIVFFYRRHVVIRL
jgi:hypothetical protein